MLKLFFKSMWYGISAFYQDFLPLILLCVFTFTPMFVVTIIPIGEDYQLFLAVIGVIVGFMLWSHYMHYTEAVKYAKENKVSFKEAWLKTPNGTCDCE